MPEGLLGFPRLTSAGPFTKKKLEEMIIETKRGQDLHHNDFKKWQQAPPWLLDSQKLANKIASEHKDVARDVYEASKQESLEAASLMVLDGFLLFGETVVGDSESVNPLFQTDVDRKGRELNTNRAIGGMHTHLDETVQRVREEGRDPTFGHPGFYPSAKDVQTGVDKVQGDVHLFAPVTVTIGVGGKFDRQGAVYTHFDNETRKIGLLFARHFEDLSNDQTAQLYSVFLENHVSTFEI